MRLLKKLFKIFLLLLLLAFFFGLGYYFYATKNVVLLPEKLLLSENDALIFDESDTPIINASTETTQETTPIESLSETTKLAFVAVEDRRFFSHHGFDLRGVLRASLKNLRTFSFKEGASTISQQLIKNTHLTHQKTIKRKLQEYKLTAKLEKKYTKEEILEKYLNTIYFGHSCFGITSAAKFYFDKSPNELTLSESAILAGLVKSPNNYSPFKNPEKCLDRRNLVLQIMCDLGHISKQEYEMAKKEILPTTPNEYNSHRAYVSALFDELELLSEKYNFKLGGNLKIYTYLNTNIQERIEKLTQLKNCDFVISVLDNQTRGFKAYYSSVGKIVRPPASIIKPLLVFAPALEENFLAPATPVLDEKIDFSGYTPKNHDDKYRGFVSVREVLSKSLNVPTVKILNAMGLEKACSYMKKLDLEIESTDQSLALALGGMRNGFDLNSLVNAYSTFPNHGEYAKGGFVRKVVVENTTIYERNVKTSKVFSEETAYLTTDMLKSAVKEGTAKKLRSLSFDVAGKTGTNATEKGNLDAYTLSYTTKDTLGIWLGNRNNTPIQESGGGLPANLSLDIHQFLQSYYQKRNQTIDDFQRPAKVKAIALDRIEYEKSQKLLFADDNSPNEYKFYELFNLDHLPTQKATHFSAPTIPVPKITVKNGIVNITFDINTPKFYQFLVKKHHYASHNTYASHSILYEGEFQEELIDRIQDNERVLYTITPFFGDYKGKPINLPVVTGNSVESLKPISPTQPPAISNKDWWNY